MFLKDALRWWESLKPKDREELWAWYCGVKYTKSMDSTELKGHEILHIYLNKKNL